jgi:hypothetical protein
MPEIQKIELERDNDAGVHEVKQGERLEPVEPGAGKNPQADLDEQRKKKEKEEFERATTPIPGG